MTAELAGVDTDQLDLQIQGRTLILSGRRRPAAVEGGVYQQVEIERGYFRRDRSSSAPRYMPRQAKARYEDGMLRIELPLVAAALAGAGLDREQRGMIEIGLPDGGPREVAVAGTRERHSASGCCRCATRSRSRTC